MDHPLATTLAILIGQQKATAMLVKYLFYNWMMEKPDPQDFLFRTVEDIISFINDHTDPPESDFPDVSAEISETTETYIRDIAEGVRKMIADTLEHRKKKSES